MAIPSTQLEARAAVLAALEALTDFELERVLERVASRAGLLAAFGHDVPADIDRLRRASDVWLNFVKKA